MKRIKYILMIIISAAGLSCTVPFDMNLDDDPIIFIESYPGTQDIVTFRIIPAYSKSNSALKPEFNPDIKFTVNGNEIPVIYAVPDPLSENPETNTYIADYKAQPGDRMAIEVASEGFESIYAETTIPAPFPDRKIDYSEMLIDERDMSALTVTPDNDPDKYYAYGVQLFKEDIYFHPDSTHVYSYTYCGDQISDFFPMSPGTLEGMELFFNGWMSVWTAGKKKGYSEPLIMILDTYTYDGTNDHDSFFVQDGEFYEYDDEGNVTGTYRHISRNKIKLYTLSEEYYKYGVAQELIDSNADFIAGLAPSNFCYTNIKGGYGVFAGITCVETDWITPEFIENNR